MLQQRSSSSIISIGTSGPATHARHGTPSIVRELRATAGISDAIYTNGLVTFASALILLAAPMCQAIDVESTKSSLDMSWSQCVSILEHYKDQIQAARRAITALQELKSRMSYSRSHGMKNLPFLRDPYHRRSVLVTWTISQTSKTLRVCHYQPRRSHTSRAMWIWLVLIR